MLGHPQRLPADQTADDAVECRQPATTSTPKLATSKLPIRQSTGYYGLVVLTMLEL
jgi:hypothetical protein